MMSYEFFCPVILSKAKDLSMQRFGFFISLCSIQNDKNAFSFFTHNSALIIHNFLLLALVFPSP